MIKNLLLLAGKTERSQIQGKCATIKALSIVRVLAFFLLPSLFPSLLCDCHLAHRQQTTSHKYHNTLTSPLKPSNISQTLYYIIMTESRPGEKPSSSSSSSPSFRSVLPHEPLPHEEFGYIHLQGSLEPKRKRPVKKQKENSDDSNNNNSNNNNKQDTKEVYWKTKESLADAVRKFFSIHRDLIIIDPNSTTSNNYTWKLPHTDSFLEVEVLEDASSPPFTKIRLRYKNPLAALQVVQTCRAAKLSPFHLFQQEYGFSNNIDSDNDSDTWQFTSRPLQITHLTTQGFLSSDMAWNRSNPPKFRRLICRPGESVELLQEERQSTRCVYMSGLVDPGNTPTLSVWDQQHPRNICEAIRRHVNAFDTSGKGVEVYVPHKKKAVHSCHIGMRSPEDARALIGGLQGKSISWDLCWNSGGDSNGGSGTTGESRSILSDTLFMDYTAVTKRSTAKANARENGEPGIIKGEPSRSECTSSTDHVTIPGLVLIPEFVSKEEEEVLMAALTGPTAPWAPSQITASKGGAVKRRVQHYGYVFDYETADVKRDRSESGSDCPPIPGLPSHLEAEGAAINNMPVKPDLLETYFRQCVIEGRGWDALACTVERTRHTEFAVPAESADESKSTLKKFPDLNQLTVNVYEPGEGIGSHVDTPSAFDDGLISLSLNGGTVMEFRKHSSADKTKKLVYLPPRSLLLMSGPARYEWEHMIVTRMTDTHNGKVLPRSLRVSLTLRTAIDLSGDAIPTVTSRNFPPVWGSNDVTFAGSQADARVTPAMEREHVHEVYDAIATQWHHTRGKRGVLWPGATQFLTELPQGSIVADVGCGDGKYFPAIWEAGSYVIGSDISLPLLQQAAHSGNLQENGNETKGPNEPESRRVSEHRKHLRKMPAVAVADCMNVPLRNSSCDAAICIAVMHHLSTRERRIRCISELARIVKVGGLINIQAWALEQQEKSKRKFAGTDVFVPFNAQPKYLNKVDTGAQSNEGSSETKNGGPGQPSKSMAQVYSEEYSNAQYNEKNGLVVFKRYCHMYRSGELEELAAEVDSVTLHESGYETGNHFVILRVVK